MSLTLGTDTYISSNDADTYFGGRLYADDWTGASDADKEKSLRMARRMVDQQSYRGAPTSDDQLLAWPRANTAIAGVVSDTVPQAIQDAQCELAMGLLREDLTLDTGTRGVRRLQAGSVALEYDGSAPERRLPDAVLAVLEPYLADGEVSNSIAMVL